MKNIILTKNNIKRVIVTNCLNFAIEGRIIGKYFCNYYRKWCITFKLSDNSYTYGMKKGEYYSLPHNTIAYKSTVYYNNCGIAKRAQTISVNDLDLIPTIDENYHLTH